MAHNTSVLLAIILRSLFQTKLNRAGIIRQVRQLEQPDDCWKLKNRKKQILNEALRLGEKANLKRTLTTKPI